MKRLFSKKYNGNDSLGRMISLLRQARKSAGFRQAELGKRIGISRETVIHIEGFAECSVLSLECEVLKRWFSVCASKLSGEEQNRLYDAIHEYIFGKSDLSQKRHSKSVSLNRFETQPNVNTHKISPNIPHLDLIEQERTALIKKQSRHSAKVIP